ncbi:MAG: hypothetical protein GY953_34240 [bacterium]|nr:hypothetical protein [bacterium]
MGEIYAIEGNLEKATKVWRNIDASHGQFDVRLWWYEQLGAQSELERLREAVERLNQQ